jgi:hypothetical protein
VTAWQDAGMSGPRAVALTLTCALALGGAAVPALAKEHAAGCAALPRIVDRMRNTLLLASVHRTRGSSLAAYQVMRVNAVTLLKDPDTRECGALARFFEQALHRATGSGNAADASLELDLGYASALALAVAGRLPPDAIAAKRVDVPEAAQYGTDCPDLFALVRRLEAPTPKLEDRAAAILADLRARPRCGEVKAALETRNDLPGAVDALILDEAPQSPSGDNPVARCPELPVVLDRVAVTIRQGAPLYNKGDHQGCQRLYEKTTRALTDEVIPPRRCPMVRRTLTKALQESAAAPTAGEAAWALRRGFDKVAGSVESKP